MLRDNDYDDRSTKASQLKSYLSENLKDEYHPEVTQRGKCFQEENASSVNPEKIGNMTYLRS